VFGLGERRRKETEWRESEWKGMLSTVWNNLKRQRKESFWWVPLKKTFHSHMDGKVHNSTKFE
jgi:hypothetical protein